MKRILIISGDVIDTNMGGMGVRYWELANALTDSCQVTLAVPNETALESEKIRILPFDLISGNLEVEARQADGLIIQGFVLHFHPYLKDLNIPIAVDLYVPFLLEGLVWHDMGDWSEWIPAYEEYLRVQLELLRAGDFFFCASERQRDYWLGWLHAQKRINPHTYRDDPQLRKLIDVVPFGIPVEPPVHTKQVLRRVHPCFPNQSRIILWSGGIWDWLDPITVIQAMPLVLKECPDARLYFMGTTHPNPTVQGMGMPQKAIALSEELGLLNKSVVFGDWVPYQERVNYLLEADLGVVAYQNHIETHFSFRTRILDCIWAGLPAITTQGDILAEVLQDNQIGMAVEPGNKQEMCAAIIECIRADKDTYNRRFSAVQAKYSWREVVKPLLNFCAAPKISIDKGKYFTETERAIQAREEYLQQVIRDKDAFLEQAVKDNIQATNEKWMHDITTGRIFLKFLKDRNAFRKALSHMRGMNRKT